MMKKLLLLFTFFTMSFGFSQTTIDFDASATWIGYMNVTGASNFGQPWGVPDLIAIADTGANTLTLSPARTNDLTTGWFADPGDFLGLNTMEANVYVQDDALITTNFTFAGYISNATLDAAYTQKVFIKVFNSDYSAVLTEVSAPIVQGNFSVNYDGATAGAAHVQYGFQITGLNVNPGASFDAQYAALGNVIVTGPPASKVWDVGNNGGGFWPVNPGVSVTTVIDNLGLFPGSGVTNLGEVQAESSARVFDDGFTSVNRFKLNGGASPTGFMPTKRYVYFAVTGACTVKVWFRTGGSGLRTLFVTDGTNEVGSLGSTDSSANLFLQADYTGGASNLYIYGDNSCNISKIEVSANLGATLGTNDFKAAIKTNLKAIGNRIYLSDVSSNTEVNIYSITGALVKSFKTNEDTNFSFKSGLWIATVKTEEGAKAFKLLTH